MTQRAVASTRGVERLIKQDGDLEQVLRRQIGGDGSELAKTFATHIGESSPLMRLLNPKESDGLVSSIRSTISEVSGQEKERIAIERVLALNQEALAPALLLVPRIQRELPDFPVSDFVEMIDSVRRLSERIHSKSVEAGFLNEAS